MAKSLLYSGSGFALEVVVCDRLPTSSRSYERVTGIPGGATLFPLVSGEAGETPDSIRVNAIFDSSDSGVTTSPAPVLDDTPLVRTFAEELVAPMVLLADSCLFGVEALTSIEVLEGSRGTLGWVPYPSESSTSALRARSSARRLAVCSDNPTRPDRDIVSFG